MLNALQVKFDCGEGNEGGRFSECVMPMTAYLSTKLKEDEENKRTEVTGGQLKTMFTSSGEEQLGADFS